VALAEKTSGHGAFPALRRQATPGSQSQKETLAIHAVEGPSFAACVAPPCMQLPTRLSHAPLTVVCRLLGTSPDSEFGTLRTPAQFEEQPGKDHRLSFVAGKVLLQPAPVGLDFTASFR
jgi:hypothetical protein